MLLLRGVGEMALVGWRIMQFMDFTVFYWCRRVGVQQQQQQYRSLFHLHTHSRMHCTTGTKVSIAKKKREYNTHTMGNTARN